MGCDRPKTDRNCPKNDSNRLDFRHENRADLARNRHFKLPFTLNLTRNLVQLRMLLFLAGLGRPAPDLHASFSS